MEGTITEDDQENNSAMLYETDSERSFGDDPLETRSESDVPIRPPRPSKYGVKLFKNLSMDELELRSNDQVITSATTPNADEIDAVPFLGDDTRDMSLPPAANGSEFEADDKVTEIDQNSTLSESSTITTDEELGFDHNSLLDQQAESASDGDDDTLIYYPGSNETSDPRKTETSPAKRNSKTGSDYCRIYDRINGYDAELKGKIIHSVQEEEATEEISGEIEEVQEENSSQRHQSKQQTEGLTNEKDGVSLNVPVVPGIQHLHFHININLASAPLLPPRHSYHQDAVGSKKVKTFALKRSKRNESPKHRAESSMSSLDKPKPEIPTSPPRAKPKAITGRQVPKRSNTLPTKLAERPSKSRARSFGRNLSKVWKSIPRIARIEPEEQEAYDEIDMKGHLKHVKEFKSEERTITEDCESSTNSIQTVQVEEQSKWLYDYHEGRTAEESLNKGKNTLQNGSFAVIQEDDTSMPFTPYTLLVVCDGQLLRIPIIKHQTVPIVRNWFSQRGTFLPKDSYSLSSSLGDKMKSISDIVAHYQKHEISGLKLKLVTSP